MKSQGGTFKVDELELVSLIRKGKGVLEAEVDVDWDPDRWIRTLNLILILTPSTLREEHYLDVDCCYAIRFAMKESPELRLAIEKRWEKVPFNGKIMNLSTFFISFSDQET